MIDTAAGCLTGWIKDPDGYAGHGPAPFTFGASVTPAAYTQDHGGLVIQDSSDCVANGIGTAMRDRMLLQKTLQPRCPSRRWIYLNARKLAGTEAQDNGSQPSLAVEALNTLGWPAEEYWDYASSTVFQEPPITAMRHAYDQRGKVKCHPLDGETDLRLGIAHDLGVCIALRIDEGFRKLQADQIWNGVEGDEIGGHMFRLIGYSDALQAFVIMNSWGDRWAKGGFGLISYRAAAAADSKYAFDFVPSPTEDNPLA